MTNLDEDIDPDEDVQDEDADVRAMFEIPKFVSIELTNFLSYKSASLVIGEFTALIGPNASGKSNAVAAIKLLRDIPSHGLPLAIARRGGFAQLRHRSHGRPNDPAIRLSFQYPNAPVSFYELSLASVKGRRYRVKKEEAQLNFQNGRRATFRSDGEHVHADEGGSRSSERPTVVAPGHSAISTGSLAAYLVYRVLTSMQAVEINPAHVAELQDPSSTREFEPTGSNTASIFEAMQSDQRSALVESLAVIVPGIIRIEPRMFADKQTLVFVQSTGNGNREFTAKQMSDGTLRAFGILLAMAQPVQPRLIIIEEPEVAIHLGALRSLVEMLRAEVEPTQIIITTHSADIVDALPVDSLRVVWNESDQSRVAVVSQHTRAILKSGMMTPGELLRADSLDPERG